jgi:hypothetical protein
MRQLGSVVASVHSMPALPVLDVAKAQNLNTYECTETTIQPPQPRLQGTSDIITDVYLLKSLCLIVTVDTTRPAT